MRTVLLCTTTYVHLRPRIDVQTYLYVRTFVLTASKREKGISHSSENFTYLKNEKKAGESLDDDDDD